MNDFDTVRGETLSLTRCAFSHRQETIKQAGIEKYIPGTLERVQADMYNRYMYDS